MCEKHKVFFRIRLTEWKKDLVKANNEALYFGSMDDNSISADVVDQASSYTDKNVEMKAINRQIKLISEIDKALARIREDIYGYCLDTAEPIGLKRLIARPVAKYTIAAQEKHEKMKKFMQMINFYNLIEFPILISPSSKAVKKITHIKMIVIFF